jgi:membrane associated rhomboid family serine protease
MGIYDREYYRDERSSFLGSLNRQGQVWKTLIAINAVAFIIQMATREKVHGMWGEPGFTDGWFTRMFLLDPDAVLHGQVWRLITSAFLHSTAGWMHIVFNMVLLWWAGSEVETIYGAREFTAVYLTAAGVSGAVYVAFQVMAGTDHNALGASGAIMAVFTIFALHYPTRVVYFFGIIPMPMLLLLVLYIAQDALGLLGGIPQPIAFAAHLGGAAFGFLYFKAQWRLVNLWPTNWSFKIGRPGPKLRVYRGEPYREPPPREPAPVAPAPRSVPESELEAELDAVLEKVARHGKSSLTEREQQVLMRASEIYRNRRK